jgi:hypothetical protein
VHSKSKGPYLRKHYHEALLQAARQRQGTAEFKQMYLLRVAIERKIADLVQHGLRQARYISTAKDRLQAQQTGAAVNLRRLFTPFEGDTNRMREVLAMVRCTKDQWKGQGRGQVSRAKRSARCLGPPTLSRFQPFERPSASETMVFSVFF